MKYAKEIKTLLYEVSDEKSKIEKSNILISIKNLKKQAEVSLKKNLVTFGNKLLTMKFNIQNFTSYSLLIDFLNRVKTTFDFQLESEDFNKKGPNFSLELLVKPIIDLAQNKVSEYNKATQTLIFAVNLYNLVIGTFKNYESFNERNEKLMETLKNFTKLILENLYVEFSKKLAIENLKGFLENRKTEDENKKFKMILEFLIFFFKDHNYRMLY